MSLSLQGKHAMKRKLSKLKDHPRQAEMFGDVDEVELRALADDMKKQGLRDPIEITSDNVVIAGHQRVRAAKLLGWTEIDVIIRDDLVDKGAVEEHLINDNFVRRQLSPLARAKCIRRLMEIELGRDTKNFGQTRREELKRRIAIRMHLSTRSVSRYLLIVDAPLAIQRAFDAGKITLSVAGKTALLSSSAQVEVVRRIESGEQASAVIAECTQGGRPDKRGAQKSFGRLVRCLRREIPCVGENARVLDIGPKSMATLRDSLAVIESLVSPKRTQGKKAA